MVIGSSTHCAGCKRPVRSCTVPAYCFDCNPLYADLRRRMAEADKLTPRMEHQMNASDYQTLAARTECDQTRSLARMAVLAMSETANSTPERLTAIRVNHALLGLMGELGEISGVMEKWIYYGKGEPDRVNLAEEVGDCLWYLALACSALSFDMGAIMQANIAKLKARYPDKYDDYRAGNRDFEAERRALEKNLTFLKQYGGKATTAEPTFAEKFGGPAGLGSKEEAQIALTRLNEQFKNLAGQALPAPVGGIPPYQPPSQEQPIGLGRHQQAAILGSTLAEGLEQTGQGWAEPPYDEHLGAHQGVDTNQEACEAHKQAQTRLNCPDHRWEELRRIVGPGGKCAICGEIDPG